MEDGSAAEKQIFILKNQLNEFDLMNIAPINSLIDFGKFIFKENTKK
jgi:hypothetical protein